MKVKLSLPLIIGIVVVLGVGLIILKSKEKSIQKTPTQAPVIEKQAQKPAEEISSAETEVLQPSGEVINGVREIKVTAKQWEFIPNPIVVKKGEKVRLKITSTDVAHGFALPDFGINKVLNSGQEVTVEFTADKAGRFGFFCSVQCGIGHSGMRGELVVVE